MEGWLEEYGNAQGGGLAGKDGAMVRDRPRDERVGVQGCGGLAVLPPTTHPPPSRTVLQVALLPVPPEYRFWRADILCNDCS